MYGGIANIWIFSKKEDVMELEWQSDYETGNEFVDLQHRYFLDLIKRVGANFKNTNDLFIKKS